MAKDGAVWTRKIDLDVHYSQIYLVDGESHSDSLRNKRDDSPACSAGIIEAEGNQVNLLTGLHTGVVDFTVAVADRDPTADLEGYEDVAEISFESLTGRFSLVEWGGEATCHLPPLPAGPGTYRLRYHGRGIDEAHEADTSDVVIDHYLLQIWPAPPHDSAVLKATSSTLRNWLSWASGQS